MLLQEYVYKLNNWSRLWLWIVLGSVLIRCGLKHSNLIIFPEIVQKSKQNSNATSQWLWLHCVAVAVAIDKVADNRNNCSTKEKFCFHGNEISSKNISSHMYKSTKSLWSSTVIFMIRKRIKLYNRITYSTLKYSRMLREAKKISVK